MKHAILFTATCLFSFAADASEIYKCIGQDLDGIDATIELAFESNQKVTMVNMDGDEVTLELARNTSRSTVFGNYEWDGYGGSIELFLPKNFSISGGEAVEEFKTRLNHKIYSELGHVATVGFKGKCDRIDN